MRTLKIKFKLFLIGLFLIPDAAHAVRPDVSDIELKAAVRVPSPLSHLQISIEPPATPRTPMKIRPEAHRAIQFTDCMEISLLRMIQSFFTNLNDSTLLDLDFLRTRIKNPDLLRFFEAHQDVMPSLWFRKDSSGLETRVEWASLLSNQASFQYIIHDRYELLSSLPNLIHFFETFFTLPESYFHLSTANDADKFKAICESFSRKDFTLSCLVEESSTHSEGFLDTRDQKIIIRYNERYSQPFMIYESFNHDGARTFGHAQLFRAKLEE